MKTAQDMEGGVGFSGDEDSAGKVSDFTLNFHRNLKTAASDQNLTHILQEIKSSKTPVSTLWSPHSSFSVNFFSVLSVFHLIIFVWVGGIESEMWFFWLLRKLKKYNEVLHF